MLNHHDSWVIQLGSTAGTLERRAPSLHPMRHGPGVIATTEDKQAKQTTRRTVASKLDLTRSAAPQFRKKVPTPNVCECVKSGWMDTRRWVGLSEVWPVGLLSAAHYCTAEQRREGRHFLPHRDRYSYTHLVPVFAYNYALFTLLSAAHSCVPDDIAQLWNVRPVDCWHLYTTVGSVE